MEILCGVDRSLMYNKPMIGALVILSLKKKKFKSIIGSIYAFSLEYI